MIDRDVGPFVDGKPFFEHVDNIRQLKRDRRLAEASDLLLRICVALERDAARRGGRWYIAPWYYEQLAIIFRKQKNFAAEVAVLEHYRGVQAPELFKFEERLS